MIRSTGTNMGSSSSHKYHIFWPHFLIKLIVIVLNLDILLFFSSRAQAQAPTMKNAQNSTVTGLFVFGDSTVDPGNNNYIPTLFKGNFRPYGRDFVNHVPTGRLTNGRLASDFVASYVGVKNYVPPYLEYQTLSMEELMTGVSFASAGSGYDPLTPKLTNVIDMTKQLEYFRDYKKRLELKIGKKRTENHIKKALFLVSAGTNDFVANYYLLPIRRSSYTVSAYQHFVIQNVKHFIQDLMNEGAQRIAVVGLPPIGCLPIVMTLFNNTARLQHGCVEKYSSVAREYNQILQLELSFLRSLGRKVYYVDIYNSLTDMIRRKEHYGFDHVSIGCCGTGYLELGPLCNPKTLVCPDASKYIFWDSIHPSEMTCYYIVMAIRPTIDMIIKD